MIRNLHKIRTKINLTNPHTGAHEDTFLAEPGKLVIALDDQTGLVGMWSPGKPKAGTCAVHRDQVTEFRFAEGDSPFDDMRTEPGKK
jgi:hypothetical protein